MHDDIIICGNYIRDVFEITKVQTETNISQNLGKFACYYKDLLVLMTSSFRDVTTSKNLFLKIYPK